MRFNIFAAMISLASFGFSALMAWTGKLVGIDSTKVRLFAWIVEDIFVGNFGRVGATVLLVGLGLVSVPAVLCLQGRSFSDREP